MYRHSVLILLIGLSDICNCYSTTYSSICQGLYRIFFNFFRRDLLRENMRTNGLNNIFSGDCTYNLKKET